MLGTRSCGSAYPAIGVRFITGEGLNKLSLKIDMRLRLTCPRHRNYNAGTSGELAIKGGCRFCIQILEVDRLVEQLEEKTKSFQDAKDSFKSLRDAR